VELIGATVDRFDALGLDPGAPLMAVAWLARWATAPVLDRDPAGFPPLDAVLARALEAGAAAGPRALLEMASRAFVAGCDEECVEIATVLVRQVRERGTLHALPGGLGISTLAQVVLGRHREAWISGSEAMAIAHDTGQPLWVSYAAGALAYLAAVEGDEDRCREHAGLAALDGRAPASATSGAGWAQAGLALLDSGPVASRAASTGCRRCRTAPAGTSPRWCGACRPRSRRPSGWAGQRTRQSRWRCSPAGRRPCGGRGSTPSSPAAGR
jgi:hypothetical protein